MPWRNRGPSRSFDFEVPLDGTPLPLDETDENEEELVLEDADWPTKWPVRRRRVRKRLYVFFFILLTALFSIGQVRILHRYDSGFLRLERLYPTREFIRLSDHLPIDDKERARELGISLQEMYTYETAVEDYLARRRGSILGPLDWGLSFNLWNYTMVFSYRIFLNMAVSAIIAWALYIRARDDAASRVIDGQNRRLKELNTVLERKVEEARRYLRELEAAQSKLVQAQKLASIGRMSATLAHEIRNPLSIMMSAAGIAAEDVPAGSPPAEALDLIRQEIARLDQIITELLNFARPKPPRVDEHDLNALLNAWSFPLEEELEKSNVTLELKLGDDIRQVIADADQLYQVFLNVVWNARDAVQENGGGRVEVSTLDAGEGLVEIVIRDDGPGMDKDMLQQILEPFYTTKTSGSGLGLPVVVQLMEGMGGAVQITSEMERGTTVRLLLRPVGSEWASSDSRNPAVDEAEAAAKAE
ncbi:MAG: two-component system, NtrC family, sensor histidine kinase HydH [Candidatus Sumerlaeota bacterium]|nr:two-component system, NtrC family, sensor histidine kinase HydH [Candidatus Sumerlaeota bacterium]